LRDTGLGSGAATQIQPSRSATGRSTGAIAVAVDEVLPRQYGDSGIKNVGARLEETGVVADIDVGGEGGDDFVPFRVRILDGGSRRDGVTAGHLCGGPRRGAQARTTITSD
jgi:hypothetical protein